MKKLISLTVAVAMTLSMAACGSKTTETTAETTAAATETTATEAAETQVPPLKQVKLQVMPTP